MKKLRDILCLAVIALCVLWTAAFGAPVNFAWDAPAPERGVTRTDLRKKLPDGSTVFLAESTTTTATVDLPPGPHVIVATDLSLAGWSEFSDPLTVVVVAGGSGVGPGNHYPRFIIQSSVDLIKWDDEFEILNKPPGRKFWRIQSLSE